MTWEPKPGAGIAIHPFIASGKKQISLLTGDQFQIYSSCQGWFHGRNLLTQIDGIFPQCCVVYYPLKVIDQRILLSKKEDLLQIEAQIAIAYALHVIKESENALLVCRVASCMQVVIEKLNYFRNKDRVDSQDGINLLSDKIYMNHLELARSLNNLRKILGEQPAPRTIVNEYSTLTTWGDEQFTIAHGLIQKNIIKPPEYVNLHLKIELLSPKKAQYYRIFLYQKERHPWISLPVSRRLGPENTSCDLVFTSLEKKDMKQITYFVVYIYDISTEETIKTSESYQNYASLQASIKNDNSVNSPKVNANGGFNNYPNRRQTTSTLPISNTQSPSASFNYPPKALEDPSKPHSTGQPEVTLDLSKFPRPSNNENIKPNPSASSSFAVPSVQNPQRRTGRSNSFQRYSSLSGLNMLGNESMQNNDVMREMVGCGQLRLPSCKTDLALKRPTTTYNFQFKTSTSAEFIYGLHEPLISGDINCQTTLKNILPDAKVSFTPFYGKTNEFLEKENLTPETIIEPLFLPSVMPAKFRISKVVFSIVGLLQHSSRKRSRIVCRVINRSNNSFLNVIEDPITNTCHSESWSSVIFKGVKMLHLNFSESFMINLVQIPPEQIRHLFIVVEIQRLLLLTENRFVSSSYATIPLSTYIGNVHQVQQQTIQLHHFPFKNRSELARINEFLIPADGSDAGSVDISINILSTLVCSFDPMYKLINFTQFENEIEDSLRNFTQLGLPEISKFFIQISQSLVLIMSTRKQFSRLAFDQLTYVFSEILTRARQDYVKQIDEFIIDFFRFDQNRVFILKQLSDLHNELIPRLVDTIQVDDTTQQFRNIVKCSSYFLKMSMKSLAISCKLRDTQVDSPSVLRQLEPFFNRLRMIVADVPTENTNVQRRGFIFTNQQLVMQQFAKIISAMFICIRPELVAQHVISFIKSVRYVPEDKKQIPIDKSKLKILHALASTKCWIDPKSRALLEQIYTYELMKAAGLPHCVTFIVPILSSLFLSVRNNFIVKFTNVLADCYKSELDLSKNATSSTVIATAKQNVINMTRLLLIIAFTFPENFSIGYLLELVKRESLGANERMFVFSNAILAIKEKLKGPETSDSLKVSILKTYLDLAILTSHKTSEAFDDIFTNRIYPRVNDYVVCREIFDSLPESLQISANIIEPILHCYMNDQSKDLMFIYIKLIRAHLRYESLNPNAITNSQINPNCPDDGENSVLNKTLFAAFRLVHFPNFIRIYKMYEFYNDYKNELQISYEESRFLEIFKYIFISFNIIREISGNLDNVTRNEEKISDAINSVSDVCKSARNRTILAHLIYEQAKLQMKVYNHLEACYSFMRLIEYIPCTLDPVPEAYQIDGGKTGVEVHRNVMLKCIDLCEKANYEEHGLEIIKKLKDTVIKPFKYYELMKTVLDKESYLYRIITTTERRYSSFYLLKFSGEGFDENYYRNKSYVYRRSYEVNLSSMTNEIKMKFPFATVSSNPAPNDSIPYIEIQPLSISNESEAANPYARPPLNPKENHGYKYHFLYSLNKKVQVFRCESSITLNLPTSNNYMNNNLSQSLPPQILKILTNGTRQTFVFTSKPFPFMSTRIIVDSSKTISRVLIPIDTAILDLRRSSFDMRIEINQFKKIYDNSVLEATTSAAMSNMTGKTSRARSPTLIQKLNKPQMDGIYAINNTGSAPAQPVNTNVSNSSGKVQFNNNPSQTANQAGSLDNMATNSSLNEKRATISFANWPISTKQNETNQASSNDASGSNSNALKRAIENGSVAKFTTDLNNTLIDSIEGKVSNYADAFLIFMVRNSSAFMLNTQKISVLKDAFKEKIYVLYDAIQIANTLVSDQMKGINDKTNENFYKLKRKIETLV